MPDVEGMNLQDAQELLRSIGSYALDQEDASGRARLQIRDRNWRVCSQSPDAGTEMRSNETVTLWSVKRSEECP